MTQTSLYPLKLERFLSPRLWGGQRLESFLKLDKLELEDALGESWQVYAENHICNGELQGETLAELAKRYGEELLGYVNSARYGQQVPLLAKFIDAADWLSIQVHPDDQYARTHEAESGHLGKTEAWYILAADEGAEIIWGLKHEVTPQNLKKAIEQGELEPHLNKVAVQTGDVIYNPAGTIHAVGEGIFLFEIQQSSDLTYRLYDYQRRDAAGNLRQLHVDKALAVANLTPGENAKFPARLLSDHKTELIRVEHFAMERWQLAGKLEEQVSPASFEILTVIQGQAVLHWQTQTLSLYQGESIVLPACLGAYHLEGEASLLRCYVPEHETIS